MVARIYQPAKNAMQSGRGNSDHWLMDFEASAAKRVEPLMGWTSASDMKNNEVRLKFDSREAAIAFAEKHGIDYQLIPPTPKRRRIRTYSDNFRSDRTMPWTH
ncbi:MAG TPA: ETC complex I subunit [Alphaproteobacteria bacterium]|jgi:hypothetical protein|nr:ETC complex I subunit [Alphaproteobacteria bacterium]HAM47242.1 ETC complex I subunit [Alphaproteobacteria bacterium]HBA43076.1 ETC complex I subunit [Alphaproteobacteria bacterium]HBC53774.1 ETC complex I subunit [Alphaproteobacteria bacterium]HBF99017.1 ETC complex I subunit [Alphaproteobacteria bacterium]